MERTDARAALSRSGGAARLIREGHKAGREGGYGHPEQLANLDQLPSTGFDVYCVAVKIKGVSAGWTRAVAIVDP